MKKPEGPYLLASVMAAVLWIAASRAPGYGGGPAPISWAASLAHIGYLNGILGLPWYNGVCWTLGIEFQFYQFVAVAYLVRGEDYLLQSLVDT